MFSGNILKKLKDPKTFNIDPQQIEDKINSKTKAIYVVHYGGQMCDMDPIMAIAKKHNLYVLEDCAHAHLAKYKGRMAGTIGDIGTSSFLSSTSHEYGRRRCCLYR